MNNKKTKILIILLIIIILAAGGFMAYKIMKDKQNKNTSTEVSENGEDEILTAGVEEKNIKISFKFSKTYESSMKKEKENKSSQENYAETNYTKLGGYEYYDKFNYYGVSLLNKNEEGSCLQVIVKISKNKNNGANLDVTEFAKTEELKNILSSMTLNDKIEGKKVDGIISSNHK